jgi:hypothetical protein
MKRPAGLWRELGVQAVLEMMFQQVRPKEVPDDEEDGQHDDEENQPEKHAHDEAVRLASQGSSFIEVPNRAAVTYPTLPLGLTPAAAVLAASVTVP